jgi:UDPglucose--hexose-1-phosphate uridylyltransferase
MRELRRDPLTGDEVLLSEDRVLERIPTTPPGTGPEQCPFCPGHEVSTTPTIDSVERDGRWVARAFANRRPAVALEGLGGVTTDGPYERTGGIGAHEVLVEAPEHAPLHTLPVERTIDALTLGVRRLQDLRNDSRLRVLQWFRNHGTGAGASQPHPHAQIVGLPLVPRRIAALVAHSRAHHGATGRSLLAAVREADEQDRRRVLFHVGPVLAVCPFAPRHPFEVWLVPEAPGPSFADATAEEIDALARAMHRVYRALAAVVGDAPTTATALGAPTGEAPAGLGWHVRIAPRLVVHAGLEEATGLRLHAVFPEQAADLLRRRSPAADGDT